MCGRGGAHQRHRPSSAVEGFNIDEGMACIEGILDHAGERLRRAIRALPDGVYRGSDGYDDDCFEPADLSIEGDRLDVDFTGAADQIRGFKNSSIANTCSAVHTALSMFFEPDIPCNEGTFRCVTTNAPQGPLVNARPPAPLTMNTVFPAHRIIQACWRALGQADPERACAGWGRMPFRPCRAPAQAGAPTSSTTAANRHEATLSPSSPGFVSPLDGHTMRRAFPDSFSSHPS